VAQAAADGGKPVGGGNTLSTAEREELARLRRENKRLQQERDILAKATAWFAAKGEKTSIGSTSS
jgi:transposase